MKSYGHLCQIYQNHSPNMVMSRDSGFNLENFYFSLNSVLNFRKSYQIWEKLAQEQKITGKKQTGGVENTLPPPSAYRVKSTEPLS